MDSKIIILGDVRIRAKSIKNYGLSYGERYFEKIYRKEKREYKFLWKKKIGEFLEWKGEWLLIDDDRYEDVLKYNEDLDPAALAYEYIEHKYKKTYRRYRNTKGELIETDYLTSDDDVCIKKEKYLYITTYQKDNFVFYQCDVDFNIEEKCKEIDSLFS